MSTAVRCTWANPANPRYIAYHDDEWGVPCHDERRLFEMLNLEGAQAGLSWETILNKRDTYRAAFDDWDPVRIAAYGPDKVAELLANPGIVRNRLKVAAAISNAQAYLRLREQGQTLDGYLWGWVDNKPIRNHIGTPADRMAKTDLSDRISKDLGKRGFKFVGSTIVYAYLQGIGIVNDHDAACFRHAECARLG
ncbi:DNA-3-methyladenine glycosylase I [Pseudoduganella albidiflava]|uniref:DNA-3-methyladenine glycosylase n=1 Tax=Pseudoduganella albidiflava TaxID=321983 RepID=A0A411X4A6_9BURK|nr:DNA-3-methyladenine glycosylase I [Pseudoduganella albidiflava]QBI03841.1 DNA-3-methyladenine glycosylase I [Pseudoduganella albidiflava]GGY69414.1 DNA-3-methyladenine glycosylase [Pseudoduganella albidiflava]